jgi:7-cyano-7-deazaguanine synthase
MNATALVLFSGGQDSTTCLAWALARYSRVETVAFDYGQRHRVELEVRPAVLAAMRTLNGQWNARLGEDHTVDLRALGEISETALTRDVAIKMTDAGLPSSFVPGRNLLFFTYAAAIAYRRGLDILVGGMCETDYSGYPDCRDTTIKAMQVALMLGMDRPFRIETPLMWLDKAATWQLGYELGGESMIEILRTQTHTCYLGSRKTLHAWGYGCGECPACELRLVGYSRWTAEHAEL